MKRSERLSTVLDLAESREKQAAQHLGEISRKLDAAQRSLENLKNFRENYAARFRQFGDQGQGVRQLLEFRVFLSKINSAVLEQEKAVAHVEKALAKSRADWEAARRQTLGMKTVVDKARVEESKVEEKRLQAEQDERAGRRSGRGENMLAVFL